MRRKKDKACKIDHEIKRYESRYIEENLQLEYFLQKEHRCMDLKRMSEMLYLTFERAWLSGTQKVKCDAHVISIKTLPTS